MSIVRDGDLVRLEGVCRVEDAEPLTVMLQTGPQLALDLSACEGLHTAVVQTLLAFAPEIRVGPPPGGFVAQHLLAALTASAAAAQSPEAAAERRSLERY